MKHRITSLAILLFVAFAAFGQQLSTTSAPPAAPVPTISAPVPGNAAYTYWVIVNYPAGASISLPVLISNAPITLTSNAPVSLQWPALPGAISYDVVTLTAPAQFSGTCSACAVVTATTQTSVNDIGGMRTNYSVTRTAGQSTATIYVNNRDYTRPQLRQIIGNDDILAGTISGNNLPAYCSIGDTFYMKPTGSLYGCSTLNTWTFIGGNGGGKCPSGLTGQIQYASAGNCAGATGITTVDGINLIAGSVSAATVTSVEGSFLTTPPAPGRNDLNAAMGWQFQVSRPITVTSLSRGTPTNPHLVNLWDAANKVTPIASATVTSGSTACVYLGSCVTVTPVTLVPGHTYACAVNETVAGDLWQDNFTPTTNGGFGVVNSIFINYSSAFGPPSSFPVTLNTPTSLYDSCGMVFSVQVPLFQTGVATGQTTASPNSFGITTTLRGVDSNTPILNVQPFHSGTTPAVWPVNLVIDSGANLSLNTALSVIGSGNFVTPYPLGPYMLGLFPDVNVSLEIGSISTAPAFYAIGVQDNVGNHRYSLQNDGSQCFGAAATQILEDVCVARTAAGTMSVISGAPGSTTPLGTFNTNNLGLTGAIITGGKSCTINTTSGLWTCV